MKRFGAIFMLVAIGVTAGLSAGCESDPDTIDADYVKSNMTPELQSVAMGKELREMKHARTIDHNLRQIWDDIDSIMLLDQPLGFSRYYIP